MPRRALLSQEEKRARARERDRLKKRRWRENGPRRSLERQRNALAMRRRQEQGEERPGAPRWRRRAALELGWERRKDREARQQRRQEEQARAWPGNGEALVQLWERKGGEEEEDAHRDPSLAVRGRGACLGC